MPAKAADRLSATANFQYRLQMGSISSRKFALAERLQINEMVWQLPNRSHFNMKSTDLLLQHVESVKRDVGSGEELLIAAYDVKEMFCNLPLIDFWTRDGVEKVLIRKQGKDAKLMRGKKVEGWDVVEFRSLIEFAQYDLANTFTKVGGIAPAVTLKRKHKRGAQLSGLEMELGGELQRGAGDWLMTLEKGCRRLQVMVGELSLRSHEEPEDVGGAISLAGWVKNMADDMLDIIWELEEGPDPQLESCIDWTRARGMMSTCYALFAEGRNLHYKLEERLMGDGDMEDENWQENGVQEDKANSGVDTDNNNNNNINNRDNDNNNGLNDSNNDNNNISNNNDFNNNDFNNNNNDNNNVYINNNEDYNGSSDAVGTGADNNNKDDGDDNNNNCDDGGSGDGGGSDDGDRDVGIGDDKSDGDDNNNNNNNNNNRDGDDNNNNCEDGGNDDGSGSSDDGGSNDHGSSRAESISTTGNKPHADMVGSGVDTDRRVICGVM
ncbi:hypothetical protein CBR_g46581 [Chara braunii]|uniref:Uncharacterized protein n=1 Tax=Chara braunii TaxID=69332 RepID=A0A388M0T0_CHABU|nr:hypothetical protein CBR_g46581 [Chara braunii]|eukprot:GBG88092.1 hypothetical protein CBR_g46581 [Chara braunii]